NGSNWNCNCHDNGTGLVHNGTFEGPWPIRNVAPFDDFVSGPVHEPNGAELYVTNCKACHNGTVDVANDIVTGMTMGGVPTAVLTYDLTKAQIDTAIVNFGGLGMASLSSLTDEQRQKIADAVRL
ncbi:MAG: cytochrome c, partial [Thermodesulfovibrionales bacterium]